jgi:hypothetical protein
MITVTEQDTAEARRLARYRRWAAHDPQKELIAYLLEYWTGVREGTEEYPNRYLNRLVEQLWSHTPLTQNEVDAGIRTMERRRGAARAEAKRRQQEADKNAADLGVPPRPVRPKKVREDPAPIGVYEHKGEIYSVRKVKGRERYYALRLVETPPRLAANGETVHHDFRERAYGMVFQLRNEERITDPEKIAELSVQTGACAVCGHAIWREKSVRRMIGTRCWKRVTGKL